MSYERLRPRDLGWALVQLLAACAAAAGLTVVAKHVAADPLRNWVEAAGPWAPVALVVAKALTLIVVPLPGLHLYPMAGALFGAKTACCYLALGDFLGATVAFTIARHFGRPITFRLLGAAQAQRLESALERLGTWKGVLVACIVLTGASEVVAWGAGLTRIRFVPFAVVYCGTGLVTTIALAWVGATGFAGS